ncbi:MAG TPA: SMP-30/gluconolactonase/LRE family protein [Opitutus sp.]|nr:SMP-30/gluconolactonase/LRE family protein [Opitutus sp.]
MSPFGFRLPVLVGLTLGMAALHAAPPAILPGVQRDGSVLLPNQWSLRPAGRQLVVGDFPVNLALHPGGKFAAVLHSGYGQHEIRILNLRSGQPVSQVALPETFYGLAWSPDGRALYASGAGAEVIHAFTFADGFLSHHRELRLRPAAEEGVPAGIAVAGNGRALYVAECWGQRVDKVATRNGRVLWTRSLAPAIGSADIAAPAAPRTTSNNIDAPFPYTCVADERRDQVYVSLWAHSIVLVLNAKDGAELARWPVGAHPNEMALAPDGRLFVAEANLNTVSVVDTATGRIVETLSAALFPQSPPGAMPNSLALSPDARTLYVANANNNNVAVFDVSARGHAVSLGFIPVGWFPTSVRVTRDGKTLVVANGKGVTSLANPHGPFPGDARPQTLSEYIGGLMRGTVALIPLPASAERTAKLGEWTQTAYACSPYQAAENPRGARPDDSPIPAAIGGASPIRHVIYVVRENRTYDQVFGDIAEGNGEPQLCLFPEPVTPNAHALAREFVLLDNFYADGEVSADGHEWSMGAYATDFVEKMWPLSYGHNADKKYDYPSEGRYLAAFPANGYLWNRAAEAGVSYRTYGEFTDDGEGTPDHPAKPSLPVLRGHVDTLYPSWDINITDVSRAARFATELARFERAGDMPRLQVVQLPSDHTSGGAGGQRTPTAMVADNDLALGQIVAAVSRSKFWADTAIFVLEDDAQNGPDHVDAHRMPALVISPWTRRHAVDSTLYSTTSMLRTIELILGLQPMSQYDAAAMPMWASFAGKPDLAPYEARPAQVPLDARNPKTGWAARASRRMDFSKPDRVDDIVLNRVVWRSVRGEHSDMPAPVRAAFFKPHPKTDDDD